MKYVFILLISIIILGFLQKIYFNKIALNNIDVNIKFDKKSVEEGSEFKLIEEIINNSNRNIRDIKLIMYLDKNFIGDEDDFSNVSDKKYFQEIFSLDPNQSVKRELSFTCNKMGIYQISKCYLIVSDLYYNNFFKKEIKLNSEIVVYPANTKAPRLNSLLQDVVGEIESRTSIFSDPFIFQGIRDYQTYDTFNMINWNASLKTGDLKVNKPVFTSDREVNIILDLSFDNLFVEEYLFEELLRVTAEISQRLLKDGIGVSISTNQAKESGRYFKMQAGYSMNHLDNIRYYLSGLDFNCKTIPIEELISDLINNKANHNSQSPYLLISTQNNKKLYAWWNKLLIANSDSIFVNVVNVEDSRNINNNSNTVIWRVA